MNRGSHKLSIGSAEQDLERRYTIQSHQNGAGHLKIGGSLKRDLNRAGSFNVLPKLRESKWFHETEARIFCAVIEIGFIVEVRQKVVEDLKKTEDWETEEEWELQQEERVKPSWFGLITRKDVILKNSEGDKKTTNFRIEITTIDQKKRPYSTKLTDIWTSGQEIRINNFNDKNKVPHTEKDILDKINFARKSTRISFHNSEHFSFWCRYGDMPGDLKRQRLVSECVRWGSVGMGAGMLMLLKRKKSVSK